MTPADLTTHPAVEGPSRLIAAGPTAYVVLGGIVAVGTLPFVWALGALSLGLAVVIVGLLLPVVLLALSDGLTRWHRARAAALLGVVIESPREAPAGRSGLLAWLSRLQRPSTWRQLAYHAVVAPAVLGLGAGVIAFAWGGGVVLVTAPVWSRLAPGDGRGWRADTFGEWVLAIGLGVVCLELAPRLAHWLAALDVAIATPMLGATRGEQLSPRVTALEQTRAGVIDAADAERRRIERDLHDGAQQRLTSLALNLGMARSALAPDAPTETRRAIEDAHDEAKQALAELRSFVRGLHPAVLDERGLDAALSGIVARTPIPTSLHVLLGQRPPRTVEAVAYFVVSEALTNIAKHARATKAAVRVTSDARRLVVEVTDNGVGGATAGIGSGLTGLASRVAAVDGRLDVTSPSGGPTVLRAEMPCVL